MKQRWILYVLILLGLNLKVPGSVLPADTITKKKNEVFTIKLKSAIAQGYSWQLQSNSDSTCLQLLKVEEKGNTNKKDGGDNFQEFFFIGKRNCMCTLKFKYSRPWVKTNTSKVEYKIFSIRIN